VDEALLEIQATVERPHAQRVVIDTFSGFELARAPTFRYGLSRVAVYRMAIALTGSGVTVHITVECKSPYRPGFSADLTSFVE
jgi:circadian clock protein KaiC